MKPVKNFLLLAACLNILFFISANLWAQDSKSTDISIDLNTSYQTMEGFGAALAYYEGWLTAHPKKSLIYEAVFGELSLDILRVRNAYDYDAGMIGRVKEFATAAESVRGSRIPILTSSWGPPGYLKSNGDKNNGGSIHYTLNGDAVEFDYAGFAQWWDESLDEYNANGVYPDYISIQNEPDWSASYESCRFDPVETVNASDTIAGYNKALDAVYDAIQKRAIIPKILGPEVLGIGYNQLENYTNPLDISKLYGLCHHLYHGVDENNPFATNDIPKVGNFHPEVPHFQTEFSRGDWYSLAGLIYRSLADENAVAYFYWDLIWDQAGLVALDFPWDSNRWTNSNGFTKTKEFYSFKQYSAFIHPGWTRVDAESGNSAIKGVAFINPGGDSLSFVVVNRSLSDDYTLHINIPGYKIATSNVYRTSETEDCELAGPLSDSTFLVQKRSVATVDMKISVYTGLDNSESATRRNYVYPNPTSDELRLNFFLDNPGNVNIEICDVQGRLINMYSAGMLSEGQNQQVIDLGHVAPGIYIYRISQDKENLGTGRFCVK